MSWDGCSKALHEGFSILPILVRYELSRRLSPLSKDERGHTASVTREHKFLVQTKGTCESKNFDETVCLQTDKRKEKIRERLQGIADGTSSASRLASSFAASFLGRNECPGTHCSLVVEEERKDSSCQIYQRK